VQGFVNPSAVGEKTPLKIWVMPWLRFRRPVSARRLSALCFAALLLAIPLHDSRPVDPRAEYKQAAQEFAHGQLAQCQALADLGFRQFSPYDPLWASKFQLLKAEAMEWRGMYHGALESLNGYQPAPDDPDATIRQLAVEGMALAHEHQFPLADEKIAAAERICTGADYPVCGEVFRARGIFESEQGRFSQCHESFLSTLNFARAHKDSLLEASASMNLGWTAIQLNHFDEAVDWLSSAYRTSTALGDEDLAEKSSGNLGWAYLGLGDSERALGLFTESEKSAAARGDVRSELGWMTTIGFVQEKNGDLARASTSYQDALTLATELGSKEDVLNTLEVMAYLSIDSGKIDDANAYLDQLEPLLRTNGNRLDELDVLLAQGEIAAARGPDAGHDAQAESIFRTVASDPASQTSMRLGAEHELAKLDERRGDLASADRMYATALADFEQARSQLQKEDSKIPFLTNAAPIYDDYIHLLVKQGRVDQALALADHSRARTLAAGLGLAIPAQPVALSAGRIAQKAGATLLFYWLGQTQSYLWAITPQKTALFPLPAAQEIARMASRYRDALLGPDDPIGSADPGSANPDGQALYRILVAPAAPLIGPGANVVILADGALSRLNFETLLAPAPHLHYWIEDATVVSAPSLTMLASAKPSAAGGRSLLLLGDAVSPDPDYPALPKAAVEMREIERHFPAQNETVFAGRSANPRAYTNGSPQQFVYIHFVAHGVASLTDPLDSAILLSRSAAGEDSFKLYARAIIQHPIHARLVTISSCYGGGTRTYAGEGLVGLSWAFLRAGAHNVIGALWEVSDDSTPALMDSLYAGLEKGLPPSAALRRAQLDLLHQHPEFRSPFFWAPFQLYTGL
jgi:CHAT domain-containing protein